MTIENKRLLDPVGTVDVSAVFITVEDILIIVIQMKTCSACSGRVNNVSVNAISIILTISILLIMS